MIRKWLNSPAGVLSGIAIGILLGVLAGAIWGKRQADRWWQQQSMRERRVVSDWCRADSNTHPVFLFDAKGGAIGMICYSGERSGR